MTTGPLMFMIAVLFTVGYLLLDLLLWLVGQQTLSQWIITKSKQSPTFAVTTLLFLIGIATLLILHFELVPILYNHVF